MMSDLISCVRYKILVAIFDVTKVKYIFLKYKYKYMIFFSCVNFLKKAFT